MKQYEKLSTSPVEMTVEENILAASGEKTECKIDPVKVTVDDFTEVTIEKSFDFSLE